MRYQISDGERSYHVEIEEIDGHTYDLRVDGGPVVRVDAQKTPRTGYSLLIGGRQYEGSVDDRDDGSLLVHVGGEARDFRVEDERSRVFASLGSAAASGRQEIRAPMPGKIVKLLVKEGAEVAVDQPLVVIEAMKMENELKTAIAGTVTEIKVTEGSAVEAQALLLIVEPPSAEPSA
jgi:biotin carboxyl carrier protein